MEEYSWQLATLSDIYDFRFPATGYILSNAEKFVEKIIREFFYVRNVSLSGLMVRILTTNPLNLSEMPKYKLYCDIDAVFVNSESISKGAHFCKQVLPKVSLIGDIDRDLFSQGFIFEAIEGNPVVSFIKSILRGIGTDDGYRVAKELLLETLNRFEDSYPDWAINLSDFLEVDPLADMYFTDFDDMQSLKAMGIDF